MKQLGLEPLGRVVSYATVGVEPNLMGEAPIFAGKKALGRAGWNVSDLDLVELNEAFAAQSIACVRGLELDAAKVNVSGAPSRSAIPSGRAVAACSARSSGR